MSTRPLYVCNMCTHSWMLLDQTEERQKNIPKKPSTETKLHPKRGTWNIAQIGFSSEDEGRCNTVVCIFSCEHACLRADHEDGMSGNAGLKARIKDLYAYSSISLHVRAAANRCCPRRTQETEIQNRIHAAKKNSSLDTVARMSESLLI